jgi:hypothetical protein
MAAKPKIKKLPQVLFVSIGESDFFVQENTEEFEHGEQVGVYKLVEVRTQRITRELI